MQAENQVGDKIFPQRNLTKQSFIVLLFVALFSGTIGFLIGARMDSSIKKSQVTIPTVPTQQVTQAAQQMPPTTIPTIPLTGYAIDYAQDSQQVYLRYRGNITIPDNSQYKNIRTNLVWHTIMQAPPSDDPNHEDIFSLKQTDNPVYDFMFVMEWDGFHHDVYIHKKDGTLEKLISFEFTLNKSNDGYNVPKINQISQDGMYAALDMYGCWYCGGVYPSTLLINTTTMNTRRIGQVSYFQWKMNGAYEYKDYQTQPCDTNPLTRECPIDPQTLHLKTGQF